jgi:hypothetical protein
MADINIDINISHSYSSSGLEAMTANDFENNNDFFSSDLFGEELLDMYSSEVMSNDIPTLITHSDNDNNQDDMNTDYDDFAPFELTSLLETPNKITSNTNTSHPLPKSNFSPAPIPFIKQETATQASPKPKKRKSSDNNNANHIAQPQAWNNNNQNNTKKKVPKLSSPAKKESAHITKAAKAAIAAASAADEDLPTIDFMTSTNFVTPVTSTSTNSSTTNSTITSMPTGTTLSNNSTVDTVSTPSKAVPKEHIPLVPNVSSSSNDDKTTSTSSSSQDVKTEESFKGVAQAAVTNLMLNATQKSNSFDCNRSTTSCDDDSSFFMGKPVDTSSSHVAALTSTNWVAACAASMSGAPPGTMAAAQAAALEAASDPAAAKAARARRASLTADERARQNRDRNREHARNTRLRKKAYVEELKRTLTEMVAQRDSTDLEKRQEKQRDLEVREVRYRVMEEFLKLRARGLESNLLARWVAILEDGFTLTIPKTDYRDVVCHETNSPLRNPSIDQSVQVLRGATECLDDASKVAIFVNNLGVTNTDSTSTRLVYYCDRSHFMMDNVNAVLDWTLRTTGLTSQGCSSELVVKGIMRATFSPASNKLSCAEIIFDTGSVITSINSMVPRYNASLQSSTADTDALLDSVLMQVETNATVKRTPSSTVSLSSNDKSDSSSSEDESPAQAEPKSTATVS